MNVELEARERTGSQRSILKSLRDNGDIPAIIYGANTGNQTVSVNVGDLMKTIRDNGRNSVISLQVEGKSCNVILSDYQKDPVKQDIIHADFLTVDMTTEISVNVRIQLDGEPQGVKDGGVLQQTLHEVSITATPDQIPQSININISDLQVNEHMTVADIYTANQFTINHDPEEVLVTILPPKQEKEISTGEQQEGGLPDNLEGRETDPSQ
ncbi:50S ribosomal protein L25/general stress protein Ctc [Bacillus marasmi]|uniref:50S ribosomal protein L25/general stress protein Ctc n=1 Tax=Bacillus marasmi TaxID=1926279 RepID=UPI0011CAF945|nr:50S ribosomal protein L25/general stress protein Ctc [Bacillus marasmi]